MKTLKFTVIVAMTITTLMSCGGGISNQPINAEGFGAIEKEIKSKFGADAYYTGITIMYDESLGNMINTTVTED